MYRIGVDVGGTFTDFTLIREEDGQIFYFKVPSTPHDPSEAIDNGVGQIIEKTGIDAADISHFGHGTTVATNMIIQRRGVTTGLLVNKGFRDILAIGRQDRPALYDYSVRRPPELVTRDRRLEASARMDADGIDLHPLDPNEIRSLAEIFKSKEVEAVAICFMHSYRSSEHEDRAREILKEVLPDAFVCTSSEVLKEFREFERMSTTVLNAYLGPPMKAYLERFLTRIRGRGLTIEPFTIHSNGGLLSVSAVARFPVRTCLSGPAAGVIGASVVGAAAGASHLITFDVGGTSTDVSLVKNGKPFFTSNREVAGYPVKTPMLDIHVIGAGGGSIGWLDEAGALKVGPHSAGASPGPAAYGNGGTEPTLTDANIVLHRLNPRWLLGGRVKLDTTRARQVIEERIARPLKLTVEEAAMGMLRIASANMGRAIRSVSTERGHALKDFVLFAYGGAGSLHGADVAIECGIPSVMVPQEPGTMCARGILLSNVSLDFVRSKIMTATQETWRRLLETFREMQAEGDAWLAQERVGSDNRSCKMYVEARYAGQNYEVVVPLASLDEALETFTANFKKAHIKEYGYDIDGREIELVNCRVQAIGELPHPPTLGHQGGPSIEEAEIERRQVYFGGDHGWLDTPIYDRHALPVLKEIVGPAIIEEMSATTVVLPGHPAVIDRSGNIVLTLAPHGEAEASHRTLAAVE